jgi:hypothetical protein
MEYEGLDSVAEPSSWLISASSCRGFVSWPKVVFSRIRSKISLPSVVVLGVEDPPVVTLR